MKHELGEAAASNLLLLTVDRLVPMTIPVGSRRALVPDEGVADMFSGVGETVAGTVRRCASNSSALCGNKARRLP